MSAACFSADLLGRASLQSGGEFLLIAEAYRDGKYDQALRKLQRLPGVLRYALLSAREHRNLFSEAGYSDVPVFEEYEKGWIAWRAAIADRARAWREIGQPATRREGAARH